MAQINYTATADLKSFSTWLTNNVDQNASTWDSTTQEGVLVLNSGVTRIGGGAFEGCTTILTIDLPNEITIIEYWSFRNCTNLTSITFGNALTSLDQHSFNGCTGLTSVTLPDSLIELTRGYIFTNCTNLTSITFGNALTKISGESIFEGCTGLTSVTLPTTLTTLGAKIFKNCTSLSTFTIPNNVTSIGSECFLNTAWWNSQSDGVIYKDNWCLGYKGSKPTGNLIINNNVTYIVFGAFQACTGLTSVTLPNTLTTLSVSCFNGCTGLTSVTLHEGIITIEANCFEGCTGLTSVTLPTTLTTLGQRAFVNTSINTIYWNCNELGDGQNGYYSAFYELNFTVIFGNNITKLPKYAFSASAITEMTLPNSLTTLGTGIFYECKNLTSITFPENTTVIPDYTFYGCRGLTSLDFLPNTITHINYRAFYGCTGLTDIIIPTSLTTIGKNAFSNCTNLVSITLPETFQTFQTGNVNGDAPFYGCTSLTTVYWNAISVGKFSFPRVFYNCPISTIIFGNSVTIVPGYAFFDCTSLTSITFGNSITSIGYNVFYGCTGLTDIVLPNTLTTIDGGAFNGCTNLLSVTSLANTPPTLGSNNFSASGDTLYVPSSSKAAYQANSSWNSAFTNIKGIYTVTTSAGENGSIDPEGSTELLEGQNITITITPEEHYRISSVLYDGLDIGTVDNFTITNIDANHTLEASFEQITYQFSTDCSDGGSIEPYGITEVVEGDSFSFSVTPDEHYRILDVTIDGVSMGPIEGYTFEDVHEGHIIYATFEHITHTITATAFEGGAIVPSGAITVNEGENQSFDIVPLEGYGILALFIDGTQIEPIETYTFTDVEADHTIQAMFYPLRVAGFNRDEMLDINYLRQDYLEQLKKRD